MSMSISAAGMRAQRVRMNTIAQNIANAQVTRTADGEPYRRKAVLFRAGEGLDFARTLRNVQEMEAALSESVTVTRVTEDQSSDAFMSVYDPAHPDANEEGFVQYPNINVVEEMVNLIDASRAYEANVTAIQDFKRMTEATLRIIA